MTQTNSKISNAYLQFPFLFKTLQLVWTAARAWTVTWTILLLIQGLLPVGIVYLTRALVDALATMAVQGLAADPQPVLIPAVLMAVLLILTEILRGLGQWVRMTQGELVQDHINGLIQAQAVNLDIGFFESSESYDHLHRACVDALHRPVALLESLGALIQCGITLIGMALVMMTYAVWLPLLLVVGTGPALVVVLKYTRARNKWRRRTTGAERRRRYLMMLMIERESAAEVRLFSLGDHLQTAYCVLREKLRNERLSLERRQALAMTTASASGLLTMAFAMFWMGRRTWQGLASLGDLALFYQAFQQGQSLMRSLLDQMGQIYSNMLFLEDLFEFLSLKPQMADPVQPQPMPPVVKEAICFEHVVFRYPHSNRTALNGCTLTLPAGCITALVGTNGAGKSTLVKLLCRFYDPDSGRITIDGIDLRDMAQHDLRQHITALFQDPVHYHLTVRENIAMGDIHALPDEQAIIDAARAGEAEAPVLRLPDGYDTVLGKWFGGAELSTGEWQRVALARALLNRAGVVILDEPTSAMDPWAEADWLGRLRDMVQGQTVLLITHRFTTAMHADLIHVMNAGRVVESGTHRTLVDLGGLYAASWPQYDERKNG